MAHLAHSAVADLRQAVREGRSVVVVGPARSGLTWLVNQMATVGFDPLVRFTARGLRTLDDARAGARGALGLPSAVERPSDLQLALADLDAGQRPRLVVVNDCHRASPEALTWLIEGALEPVAGVGRTAVPFVFEGAIDPDLELASAFPTGYTAQPLVHYVEPAIPWRTLTEVDEIVRARWRQSFTPALIPWIADVTGGDVGFIQELLERLPHDGEIRDETLTAAGKQILSVGKRAREIREAVELVKDNELLRVAASGQGLRGVPPATLESASLKRAYFAGLIVFDGIASVYRVRGPLTAHVVAEALKLDPREVYEGRFILGRLLIFFAHIAAFELDVRSLVRPNGPVDLASKVSIKTGLDEYWKPIRDAVVAACAPDPKTLGPLSNQLKTILPEASSVLEEVKERWGSEVSDDSILDRLTFSQLTSVARHAKVVTDGGDPLLAEINDHRNAFAHFRAEQYGQCEKLLRTIAEARRLLETLK